MSAIRVGTRQSKLAGIQTDIVKARLAALFPDLTFEIVTITTKGDQVRDRPIADLGSRGVFVKELENALIDNEVDLVVHSLKDLPTDIPPGLILAGVLDRRDARDVLVSHNGQKFEDLKTGSRVATSSRRRAAQLKAVRLDLEFTDIRGNIPTRISKHENGECDAMVLAAAGLLRLDLQDKISQYFDLDTCMPAVGQGALAVECRIDDERLVSFASAIEDKTVRALVDAERSFLDKLGGGCSVPVGALAEAITPTTMKLSGCVAALDGSKVIRVQVEGSLSDANLLGERLTEKALGLGAEDILKLLRESAPQMVSPP